MNDLSLKHIPEQDFLSGAEPNFDSKPGPSNLLLNHEVHQNLHFFRYIKQPALFFRRALTYYMLMQLFINSLIPANHQFWSRIEIIDRFLNRFSYIFLVNIPEFNSTSHIVITCIVWGLFYLENITALILEALFHWFRYTNILSLKIFSYVTPFIHFSLMPMNFALCGDYLSQRELNDITTKWLAVISLITLVLSFMRTMIFIRNSHYQWEMTNTFFDVWHPDIIYYIIYSISLTQFFSYFFQRESSLRVVSIISAVLYFLIIIADISHSYWYRSTDKIILRTILVSSFLTLVIEAVYNDQYINTELLLWCSLSFFVSLCILFTFLEKIRVMKIKQKFSHDYPKKMKSANRVISDLYCGLENGFDEVINCIPALDIFQKYHNSFEITYFFSIFNLVFVTCPIQIDTLCASLQDSLQYNIPKRRTYVEIQFNYGPMMTAEVDKYNKHVLALHTLFYQFLLSLKAFYGVLYDELTFNLPNIAASIHKIYSKTTLKLMEFVQTYPGSPDGDFFIKLLECIIPFAPSLPSIKKSQSLKFDHVNNFLNIFPKLLSVFNKHPDYFRSFSPVYTTTTAKCILDSFESHYENRKKYVDNFYNAKGPLSNSFTKWYSLLAIFVVLVIPILVSSYHFAADSKYESCIVDINIISELIVHLHVNELYVYPAIYAKYVDPSIINATEIIQATAELQKEVVLLATDMSPNFTPDSNFAELSIFFTNSIPQGFIHEYSSYKFAILAGTLFLEEIVLNTPNTATNVKSMEENFLTADQYHDIIDYVTQSLLETQHQVLDKLHSISTSERFSSMSVVLLFMIILTCYLIRCLDNASKDFDNFLISLRQTSKSLILDMKKYIISFDKLINDIQSQNAVFQSHKKTFNQNVCIIATLIIYVLITMLFYIFFTLVSFCYFSRVERSFQLTELMSLIISNLTHIEKYQQKADYMEMSISELTEVLNNSSELRSHVLQYMWSNLGHSPVPFCWLCSVRVIFNTPRSSNPNVNIDNSILQYLALTTVNTSSTNSFNGINNLVDSTYMFPEFISAMKEIIELASDQNVNQVVLARIIAIILFVITILLIICFPFLLFGFALMFDRRYKTIVSLLKLLPEEALTSQTISIIRDGKWGISEAHLATTIKAQELEDLCQKFPEALIVIDQSMNVLASNEAAEKFFVGDINPIGSKLFKSFTITLNEEESMMPLQGIINNHIFSDRTLVSTHTINGILRGIFSTFALTIFPIIDYEGYSNQKTTNIMALIFRDKSEEVRIKKKLDEISQLPSRILPTFVPPQILPSLLDHHRSISFTVPKACACIARLSEFETWGKDASKEKVMNIIASAIEQADALIHQYETLTRVKILNYDYCFCAGVFHRSIDPIIYISEAIKFCIGVNRLIRDANAIHSINMKIVFTIFYGGPFHAGVAGINRPFFDLYGASIISLRNNAKFSKSGFIIINEDGYIELKNSSFNFIKSKEGDNLYEMNLDSFESTRK